MKAVLCAQGEDVLVHRWRALAGDEDEWFVAAVAERQLFGRARCHAGDEHQAIFDHRQGFKFTSDREAHEAEVDLFRAKGFDLLSGGHVAKAEFDRGDAFAQADEDARDELESMKAESDTEASGLARGCPARAFEEVVGIAHEQASTAKELVAECGELDAMASACEELRTDFAFEAANLFREGGLAEVEEFGRAAEMQLLSERNERSDFAKFHNHRLSPS